MKEFGQHISGIAKIEFKRGLNMKPKLKIMFRNFWGNFSPNYMPQDYFFEFLLSHGYDVVYDSESPDLVISSVFGEPVNRNQFRNDPFIINYNCEPDWLYPDYLKNECDLKIGYGEGYYRFPLWLTYIIWDQTNLNTRYKLQDNPHVGQGCHHTPNFGMQVDNGLADNPLFITNMLQRHLKPLPKKHNFCNFTYSKAIPSRVEFFHELSKYKFIQSTGSVLNNTGYRMKSKTKELKAYKFTIAFENSIRPGYVTEKIMEPLAASSVPIYMGDKSVLGDFNPKAFIYANDFPSIKELIEYVIEIDNNKDLYESYLREPIFGENEYNSLDKPKQLFNYIYTHLIQKKPNLILPK